jgi:hypothetical protein
MREMTKTVNTSKCYYRLQIYLKSRLLTYEIKVMIYKFFIFGLGSSSALLPPGGTATSVADARGLLYHMIYKTLVIPIPIEGSGNKH